MSEEDAFRQLDMALPAGINLFDTAEKCLAPVLLEMQGRSTSMCVSAGSRSVASQAAASPPRLAAAGIMSGMEGLLISGGIELMSLKATLCRAEAAPACVYDRSHTETLK